MSAKDVDIREDRLSSSVVSSGGLHLRTEDTNSVLPILLDAYIYIPVSDEDARGNECSRNYSQQPFWIVGMEGNPVRDGHVCGGVLTSVCRLVLEGKRSEKANEECVG